MFVVAMEEGARGWVGYWCQVVVIDEVMRELRYCVVCGSGVRVRVVRESSVWEWERCAREREREREGRQTSEVEQHFEILGAAWVVFCVWGVTVRLVT